MRCRGSETRAAVHVAVLLCLVSFRSFAGDASSADFFEKKIRPALAEHCYKCHSASSEKVKGKLRLDSRAALMKGGETGPAIVPGSPEKSLLIEAIQYSNQDMQMPPKNK